MKLAARMACRRSPAILKDQQPIIRLAQSVEKAILYTRTSLRTSSPHLMKSQDSGRLGKIVGRADGEDTLIAADQKRPLE